MAITIAKAIELLIHPLNGDTTDTIFDLHDAQKLGAEALKRIEEERKDGGIFGVPLLPGEDGP